MFHFLRAVLLSTVALGAGLPVALAQTPASPGAQTSPSSSAAGAAPGSEALPPVIVEQKKEPVAKPAVVKKEPVPIEPAAVVKPKAKPAQKSATPAAEAPPQAQAIVEAEPRFSAPATLNAGTPAASTAPVLGIAGSPGAATVTTVERERYANDPVFSVGDLLKESPGVSVKQGNGPRDLGVSIRGSNARNGFAIRNVQILEDGFPVTQPDGLSRSDLIDPHAYGAVDVWRGPFSALFGNYATGGALNFRTRSGGEINGAEIGSDAGSLGYFNNYVTVGAKSGAFEGAIFASDVRGDGHFGYSSFDTQTVNLLMSWQLTTEDKLTFKFIDNELKADLPFRYSLNQYLANPFQKGCATAATAAAGCQTQFFSRTGNTGTGSIDRVLQTAEQEGANRNDRRTIGGVRWEHKVDDATTFRVQYVADDRNISQPTGSTSAVGDYFSHNVISDLSHRHMVGGLPAVYSVGVYWNYLPVDGDTWNVAPGAGAPLGLLASNLTGYTQNIGGRLREEVKLDSWWTVTAGIAVEKTALHGLQRAYRYNTAGVMTSTTSVAADRELTNNAEELALLLRPNSAWQFRGRVATAYGAPQISNLFVLPDGTSGNNTELKAQTNLGFDAGVDWTPAPGVMVSVTGFYEYFKNELVSQATAPGSTNSSFTFNAPASEHRGIEVALDLKPAPGWRLTTAYLFNDQYYTEYLERLNSGATTRVFDRAGSKIPGVAPHELTARLGYDQPWGPLKGLGAYVEYQWREAFFMENANLLEAPSAHVVNLNVHYNTELRSSYLKAASAFFEVRNVFDTTYIAAANNIQDSITAAGVQNGASVLANTSGTIYAGAPRTFVGGVKFKF